MAKVLARSGRAVLCSNPFSGKYAQDGTLRCYYLCQPQLVEDMLTLVSRKETVVKRIAEEIQADKKRLAKALEKQSKRDTGFLEKHVRLPRST